MKTLKNMSVEEILRKAYAYMNGLPAMAEEFFQETACTSTPEDFRMKVLEFVPESVFAA